MKKKFLTGLAIAIFCVWAANNAIATTLDFEGMYTYSPTYTYDNYNFNFSFSGWYIDYNLSWNENGTTVLNGQGSSHYVDISLLDGSTFSLSSIDAAIMWDDNFDSGSLIVTGTTIGGSSVSSTYSLDDYYHTFSLPPEFTNLVSLRLAELGGSIQWGDSAGISVDNLVFAATAPVPEPCTLLLLSFGLLGLGLVRRKS